MLQDNFYKIIQSSQVAGSREVINPEGREFSFSVELDRSHPVFEGHFPGNPVVPGVCQVEIIRELLCGIIGKDAMLVYSDNIKFLNMISPVTNPVVDVKLIVKTKNDDQWDVSAIISGSDLAFIKFKGSFR